MENVCFNLEAEEASRGFGEPSDLPSHLIKSRGRARVMEEEAQRDRSGGSVQSRISEYDEDSGISGFDRESMETILQELHVYVCDGLSELGKDPPSEGARATGEPRKSLNQHG